MSYLVGFTTVLPFFSRGIICMALEKINKSWMPCYHS